MMHYIVVTELESVGFTSCKIQGLSSEEITNLEDVVKPQNLPSSKQETFYEVDTQGIKMLNILASADYGYKICSQSMVIENSKIGSRTIQVQKTMWTLFSEK